MVGDGEETFLVVARTGPENDIKGRKPKKNQKRQMGYRGLGGKIGIKTVQLSKRIRNF